MSGALLEARALAKRFDTPTGPLSILEDVSLQLEPGDALSIMGPSGGGKSTLLFILGALDSPSSGSVRIDGTDPFALDETALARFRNEKVGFVFQDHCLLPQCSVLENVLAPTLVAPPDDHRVRAEALLERVGLSHRLTHLPGELSGGEKQRVAIARALIRDPGVVLCDEPTGNLDGETASEVADMLLDLEALRERVLVIVTHSGELADRLPLRKSLDNGRLRDRASAR